MSTVQPLSSQVDARLREIMARVIPDAEDADPLIRRSEFADFQADGIFKLGRVLRTDPRTLAAKVAAAWESDGRLGKCSVSGPGYLNLTIGDDALLGQLRQRVSNQRLGVAPVEPRPTVVEYSGPNIAKEMHVGHLRSTVIGDALARILTFLEVPVIRQNHLGDWGTQFGMLIQDLMDRPETSQAPWSSLDDMYRAARARFDADPSFADRSRQRVVALQAGDRETLAWWEKIVAESRQYFGRVYDRAGVMLTDDDAVGESFYNPFLNEITQELEASGTAVRSEGALCVFFDDIRGPDGEPTPLIIRKRDGGFGYAATDLAAIRYRIRHLGARRILYVVDARQALHFRMVFETARRAGWLTENVEVVHVAFGTVLGADGRPFKTRAGDTVPLVSLFDQAVTRARATIAGKNPDLDAGALEEMATQVGIGAIKYADLANNRIKDYVFDLDRMVSLSGNTGVYLQYAHARVRSILRRLPPPASHLPPSAEIDLELSEHALALLLDDFARPIQEVADTLEPHRLCGYLHALARAFTDFYESCPVLKAPSKEVQARRALFCTLTADTLRLGLNLLGIAAPDRL